MNVEILGAIELLSIADGYKALDAMVKAAPVEILRGEIINPGKFLIMISGDIASVEIAMDAGIEAASGALHDHIMITSLNTEVLPSYNGFHPPGAEDALGIVESVSIPAVLDAADRAVKESGVSIVSIQAGNETGGRGVLTFSGSVGELQPAMNAVVKVLEARSQLFSNIIIPGPHPDFRGFISGN